MKLRELLWKSSALNLQMSKNKYIYRIWKRNVLGPPDVKSQLAGKDPDAGKDWGQEEKRETEDEMVDGSSDSTDTNLSKRWEIMKDREA